MNIVLRRVFCFFALLGLPGLLVASECFADGVGDKRDEHVGGKHELVTGASDGVFGSVLEGDFEAAHFPGVLVPTLYNLGAGSIERRHMTSSLGGDTEQPSWVLNDELDELTEAAIIASSYEMGFRPIINGQLDTTQEHMGVVALYNTQGAMCTGTLISRKVVLTAAHCAQGVNISNLNVMFGTDIQSASSTWLGVVDSEVHPYYNPGGDYEAPDHDIALLRLNQDAPSDVSSIPYLPEAYSLTSSDIGSPLTYVGFGVTGGGGQNTRKYYFDGALGAICDGPSQCSYGGAVVAPYCIAYSNQYGGPCSGDSGGPALVERGGIEYVAGVTSYGDQNCEYYGVSTKVDRFQDFIEDFIGNIVPEVCHNGADDSGNGLVDCQDPECASSRFCSGLEACQESVPILCDDTTVGSTTGGSQRFIEYSCGGSTRFIGPENAYQLSAPMGTKVTATLTPTGGTDLDLFIVEKLDNSCDPDGCIGVSTNNGEAQDSVTVTLSTGSFIVVDSMGEEGGSYQLSLRCGDDLSEICDSGIDEDGDGLTDCEDPDCSSFWACTPNGEYELCNSGLDDDGDGLTDCEDPDCQRSKFCADDGGGGACDCSTVKGGKTTPWAGLLFLFMGVFGLIWKRRRC